MSKLTQGSKLYFIDPETEEVIAIDCITSFNPGGSPADQLDDTCMEDTSGVRSFKRGLSTPGAAALQINADPTNPSHVRLYEIFYDGGDAVLNWALGWSDGTAAPTADTGGNFNLPATRTWLTFAGYIADFPFDFQLNALVTSAVSVQRSGPVQWVVKSA